MEHASLPTDASASSAGMPVRTQTCSGCGANMSVPVHLVSTACTYCESPLVDSDAAAINLDSVVPFSLSAELAAKKIAEWLHGHHWAPTEVRRLGQDPRALKPVYVPHGMYDGEVRARYDAKIGITYTKTVRRGGKTKVKVKTDWHVLRGSYGRNFENHLVSASRGLLEVTSNQLEPFDLGTRQPFDSRLVAGIEAELPTHEVSVTDQVLVEELKESTQRALQGGFLPGDQQELRELSVTATIAARSMVALPIWLGSFHHNGEVHHCFVNGQTGAVVGDVPHSWIKISSAVMLILALIIAGWLSWGGG